MLFSSWQFIFVFLPLALGVFLLLPARWRVGNKLWLTLVSFFFYAYWKVEYVPLLVFSILFNYGIAEALLRYRDRPAGRGILIAGITANLSLLGYYKYTNFILSVLGQVSTNPIRAVRYHSAPGHLVFHFYADRLPGGRFPRPYPALQVPGLRSVRGVLSAPDCRARLCGIGKSFRNTRIGNSGPTARIWPWARCCS